MYDKDDKFVMKTLEEVRSRSVSTPCCIQILLFLVYHCDLYEWISFSSGSE